MGFVNIRFFSLVCSLLFLGCQDLSDSSRENLTWERSSESNQWVKDYSELSLQQGLDYYQYTNEDFALWNGQSESDRLIAVGVDEDYIILDLNEKRNEKWYVEQLVYQKEHKVKDCIAVKINGYMQLAEITIELNEAGDKVLLKALNFLTKDPSHKNYPIVSPDKRNVLFACLADINKLVVHNFETKTNKVLFEYASSPQWLGDSDEFIYINEKSCGR